MKTGPLIAILIAALGLTAVVFAFLQNASPYVSVAEAKTTKGDNLHLAGAIIKESILVRSTVPEVRFEVRDDNGDRLPVVYAGHPPANLSSATRVVAVGGYADGAFKSHKLLLKCPSKYESEKQ